MVERRKIPSSATHCFSACLYHEPMFAKVFPKRPFKARYLDSMAEIGDLFERRHYRLKIFCDPAMTETAMGFDFADVYEVQSPPAFPFAQHLYRYYAALIPDLGSIRALHFRGLDNLLVSQAEADLLDRFIDTESDIWHCPYQPRALPYLPVRGSCSVANAGITSLAHHLITRPPVPASSPPGQWHNDEVWLARWFESVRLRSRLFTIIDRDLPPVFYQQMAEQIQTGLPFHVARPDGIPWLRKMPPR